MTGRNIRTLAVFAGLAVILACAPLAAPAVPPTLDPSSLNTIIAQTAGAAATQTALLAPATSTATPPPTNTPTELPSATPTFIFILDSPTPTRPTSTVGPDGVVYSCEVQSQSPADNTQFMPGAVFSTRWQLRNNGSGSWSSGSTDYRYTGGDKLHINPIYDLSKTVFPGSSVDIIVDMKAPADVGNYSTTWKIAIGRTEFCTLRLTIVVQ